MFSGLCPPFFDGHACVKSLIRVQNYSKSNRHGAVTRLHEHIFRHGTSFTRAETTSMQEVASARRKFRALVPYYVWARLVYMSKPGSAVPKSCEHCAESLRCRAHFSARVNGAFAFGQPGGAYPTNWSVICTKWNRKPVTLF